MAWTTLGTVAPGDVLRANSGTAAYNGVIGNLNIIGSAWTSFTPTYTNLTTNNGTTAAAYVQVGKIVVYRGEFVWGSSTSATASNTTVSLPVTAKNALMVGSLQIVDFATRAYTGTAGLASTTAFNMTHSESGNNGSVNGTNPFTWGTSDYFRWLLVYEAA